MTGVHRHALRIATLVTVWLTATIPLQATAADSGLSALVSADCTNSRLQLVLNNQSASTQTFTVDFSGTKTTRQVTAGGNALLYWTRSMGTPYTITTTTPSGFNKTESGTLSCGLGPATPQMNSHVLFDTATVFRGLHAFDGTTYDGTAKSVRIPAMGVTNNNTILAATDARVTDSGDLGIGSNDIQISMRRSTDGGNTWSPPNIVAATGKSGEGFGDSSVLVDRRNNKIFLFFAHSPAPGISFNSNGSGSNAPDARNSLHIKYISSTDDGQTWSAPTELNPQVKDVSWQNLFASSGHGTQLSSGRLLQPIAYRDGAGVTHAADIYSDDGGVTWKHGGPAGENVNESKAIERGNGEVDQNLRHNSTNARFYATSTSGGEKFGSMFSSTLIDPKVNADELSYLRPQDRTNGTPNRTSTALFSNPASTTARDNLTVRLTTNDAGTYSSGALLKPGQAGYSTMGVLGDGTVETLYEIGDTGGIVFTRYTLDWLRAS